jgi:hypothetical protein
MKETIDLLGKILTNILAALYEPFGFSQTFWSLTPLREDKLSKEFINIW